MNRNITIKGRRQNMSFVFVATLVYSIYPSHYYCRLWKIIMSRSIWIEACFFNIVFLAYFCFVELLSVFTVCLDAQTNLDLVWFWCGEQPLVKQCLRGSWSFVSVGRSWRDTPQTCEKPGTIFIKCDFTVRNLHVYLILILLFII